MSITPLATAKKHLRVIAADEDDLVQAYLDAAEDAAQQFLGRTVCADQTAADATRAAAHAALEAALDALDARQEALADVDDCDARDAMQAAIDADRRAAHAAFAMASGAIAAPPVFTPACLLICGGLYENREDMVVAAGVTVAVELPSGSRALLRPYRVGLGV